jgi:hypothetical protein
MDSEDLYREEHEALSPDDQQALLSINLIRISMTEQRERPSRNSGMR